MIKKLWRQFILWNLRFQGEADISRYKIVRTKKNIIVSLKNEFKTSFSSPSVFFLRFWFKGFLLTNKFIDGGAGISLLISALSDIPLYYLIPLINLPFVIMAYKTVSRNLP
jgi:uncharacterized membrane-anchored protein YitT (DUF2179 family)